MREAKKKDWRTYHETLGSSTSINKVWGVVKKFSGIQKVLNYLVLKSVGVLAMSDQEKANMTVKELAKVNSDRNLTDKEKEKGKKLEGKK